MRVVAGLSTEAVECMGQLFFNGPTWDGNIISKEGRNDLIMLGLAFRVNGFTSLSEFGLATASEWKGPVPAHLIRAWKRKQSGM